MAAAIAQNRPTRASGELCFHVLDMMESFEDSYNAGKFIELSSGVERPAPMPMEKLGWRD